MTAIFTTAPDRARGVETETFRFDPSPLEVHGEDRRTFRYDLVAGNDVTDAVRLTNKTDDVRSFRVYAADAEERDGAVVVEPFGASDDAVGSWITVERQDVTLLPRSSEVVRFNIRRPKDQHAAGLGAIVAEEIRDHEAGAGFEVVYRLAITVHLSGDATGLAVTEPRLGLPLVLVPADGLAEAIVTNDTLQSVEARVTFSVESLTGREWSLDPLDVRLDPGEARTVSQSWSTVPRWGGVFRVRAEATWAAGTVASTSDRGMYPPLWLLALTILAVGVRGLREMWSRRRERTAQAARPAANDVDTRFRQRGDDPRVEELVGS